MEPIYYIPIAMGIIGIVYTIVMVKRHKSAKAEIDLDAERKKYDQYKQELLTQDFSELKHWMNAKPIDAFTAASVPQSTREKVQDFLVDGFKNVALKSIGMKLQRVNTACFWVLSGNDLHFLVTDTDGDLDEHIVFDAFRIENANLQYTGVLKSEVAFHSTATKAFLPIAHRITFDIDGSPLALHIHDRLTDVVSAKDQFNVKKQFRTRAKYRVVGERFLGELQSRFPHLKLN